MKPITAEELIYELNKIHNKKLPVYIYALNTLNKSEIHFIDSIDDTISDRIDLNTINIDK